MGMMTDVGLGDSSNDSGGEDNKTMIRVLTCIRPATPAEHEHPGDDPPSPPTSLDHGNVATYRQP